MFLKKQWDNRAHVDEADLFWSKVKRKRGLDKGTLSVQEAVDTFWNKRIRKEYEQDTDTFSDETTSASSSTIPLTSPQLTRSVELTNDPTPASLLDSSTATPLSSAPSISEPSSLAKRRAEESPLRGIRYCEKNSALDSGERSSTAAPTPVPLKRGCTSRRGIKQFQPETPKYNQGNNTASVSATETSPLPLDAEPTSSSSMTQSSSAMPNPFLSESDAWQDFAYFTAFGQKPTWTCGTDGPSAVDYLPLFKEYQAAKKESLALDMIADVSTNGSDPGTFTEWIKKSHGYPGLKSARFRAPISRSIQDIWPTFDTVMERVFAAGIVSYDDVCHSIAKEPDQLDPIVKYCTAVVSSYMHHFTFGNAVSRDVNEREAFVDCTWCFIRGALTIAKIPSRMLEVQIDGNKDRKEETKNGARQSTPRKADGVGLFNSNQIYVAEAARVYGAALDKKSDDAWKVKRAMRDSWVSQLRRICETERPTSPLMVFGSTSHLHTTKFYVMDFVGCFRVSLLSSMAVPLESGDFARKMKACILTCLNFAITLMDEMNNRKKTTLIQSEEEREELLELAASIPMTSMTPTKLLKY
ncbi:hypothetical protein B0O80DRAFT_437850 [Mortierella sp. GBAus27b]|nr:hypothetical protein B0O80DRAFT_437850 [Mortierella sp. GBAus27b]